jgi:hypothetical protein
VPSESSSQYFAALSTDKIGQALYAKVTERKDDLYSKEYDLRNRRAYQYYYGIDPSGVHATSGVLRGGEQGELALTRVNHSRALVNTLLNLISAAKVIWQPVAVNTDYSSAGEVELASAVLEYYWNDRQVNTVCLRALEEAITFTEGFVFTEWDETLGEDVAGIGNRLVKSGDIRFNSLSTWDVLRDSRAKSYADLNWVILRLPRNRFDLAAQYGAGDERLAQQILSVSDETGINTLNGRPSTQGDSDERHVYAFFHKPTPAVPTGRETLFLDAKTVLKDGPLTYPVWPLHRVFASEMIGTPYAYSSYHETLGVQEVMDSLQTAIASNQTTFGTQCVAMQHGSEVEVDQIAGGLKVFYYPPGGKPPEAINLTKSPPEVFAHLESLKKDQEQLMGLNGVVRGTPESGDMSGAALALLQAQAVQQSSGLQNNYLRFVESVGNAVMEITRAKCPTPRRVAISGKASRFLQRDLSYSGDSFGKIRKVMVQIGNPLSQTSAGRKEIAQDYIKMGLVKTPEQYDRVLEDGRLEPLTQSLHHELLLITNENEQLQNGEQPPVSPDDDHMLHAREHRVVMANPEARQNPALMQAYMAHVEEHYQTYLNMDPRRLILMGQQPPPVLAPPGTPPPGPGGPPPPGPQGPPPPPGGSGGHMGPPDGAPPPPNVSTGAKGLPRMPRNPASGQKFQPPPGDVPPPPVPPGK